MTEVYNDQQGEQPEVNPEHFTAFAAFIEGGNGEEEALNMEGVTGICCATVHPRIHKVIADIHLVADKLKLTPDIFLTRLQGQVAACLSKDIKLAMMGNITEDAIPITGDTILAVLEYAMQQVLLVYTTIASDFDDDPALLAARKMREWIAETHKDNLPFFWQEIQELLKSYESISLDDINDAANE